MVNAILVNMFGRRNIRIPDRCSVGFLSEYSLFGIHPGSNLSTDVLQSTLQVML